MKIGRLRIEWEKPESRIIEETVQQKPTGLEQQILTMLDPRKEMSESEIRSVLRGLFGRKSRDPIGVLFALDRMQRVGTIKCVERWEVNEQTHESETRQRYRLTDLGRTILERHGHAVPRTQSA